MLADALRGRDVTRPPETTALGALLGHLRRPSQDFQPSNVMWNMFPPHENPKLRKREKKAAMAERGLKDLAPWLVAIEAEAVRARALGSATPAMSAVEVAL